MKQSSNGSSREELPLGTVLIDNVTKTFRKQTQAKKTYSTLKSGIVERLFRNRKENAPTLKALDSLSITLEPGKSVGIIGRNGSGKSTLLKLIAGIYRADGGAVHKSGKVSALIELGAGFHPEFTGRENIYLGGVMYGLNRKQIDALFDDIVRYAELEDFIDDPVKTYSSGMYMRLGFSLAVHTDPDILLIDEVLAVGDAAFIHRCQETISKFRRRGKTMIFVTHDLDSVAKWCDEAIWLQNGCVQERGEPQFVIDSYLAAIEEKEEGVLDEENKQLQETDAKEETNRWGNGDVEITDVRMLGVDGESKWIFRADEHVAVEVDFTIKKKLEELVFGIGIVRADGMAIHGTNTEIDDVQVPLPKSDDLPQKGTYRYVIKRLSLVEDTYFLDVAAHSSEGYPYDYHHLLHKFSVRNRERVQGVLNPEHEWSFALGYEVREEKDDDVEKERCSGI